MATNINRQKILSRKTHTIHDGVGNATAICADYNCVSSEYGGTDYSFNNSAYWTNFDTTDPFSISVWVKPEWTQSNGSRQFLNIGVTGGNWNDNIMRFYFTNGGGNLNRLIGEFRTGGNWALNLWALHNHNSKCGLGISSSSGWSSANRGYKNTNDFTLVTLVYDPSLSATLSAVRFKMYWNGNSLGGGDFIYDQNPQNVTFPSGTAKQLQIGANLVTNSTGMEGNLDDMAFWDVALTDAEVLEIWNGTQAAGSTDGTPNNLLSHSKAANLKGWWRFENNFADSSGNNFHLTNNGVSFDATNKA